MPRTPSGATARTAHLISIVHDVIVLRPDLPLASSNLPLGNSRQTLCYVGRHKEGII